MPALPSAGGEDHAAAGLTAKAPYFFRLHYEIRGTFTAAAGTVLRVSSDGARDGGTEVRIPLIFPFSGIFEGTGQAVLRDVFGLINIPFGEETHRRLPILPAPRRKSFTFRIEPFSGDEEKQSRRPSDDDRYLLRDYTPGDRFRDINWKTSSRLAQLMTRVSPLSQERSRTVLVDFRNYGPERPNLAAVWTLDRMRSTLIVFLRSLREEHPEFRFRVRTGRGIAPIESERDFDDFLSSLPEQGFVSPAAAPAGGDPLDEFSRGEAFVFTSVYDTAFPAFLLGRGDEITNLFASIPVKRPPEGRDAETLLVRNLLSDCFVPVRLVLKSRSPRLAGISAPARGRLDLDYTEVKP